MQDRPLVLVGANWAQSGAVLAQQSGCEWSSGARDPCGATGATGAVESVQASERAGRAGRRRAALLTSQTVARSAIVASID